MAIGMQETRASTWSTTCIEPDVRDMMARCVDRPLRIIPRRRSHRPLKKKKTIHQHAHLTTHTHTRIYTRMCGYHPAGCTVPRITRAVSICCSNRIGSRWHGDRRGNRTRFATPTPRAQPRPPPTPIHPTPPTPPTRLTSAISPTPSIAPPVPTIRELTHVPENGGPMYDVAGRNRGGL